MRKKAESDKHQENIKEILLSSNATPIRRRGAVGYVCCFCTDSYQNPADLKDHTINSHDDDTKSSYLKGTAMLNFMVKLDITDLKCKICDVDIKGVEDLIQHLQVEHNKSFHNDIKSHFVPFRFGSDLLRCVYCTKVSNNFKIMLQHMNVHYKNYVCDICGTGFVNKRMFMTHAYRHRIGVFNCDYCAKVFNTRIKKKEHERAVHICLNKRSKCGYCGDKFTDYAKKNDHETKLHGAKLMILKCQACDKSFDNQRALTIHTKTYHLLERYNKKTYLDESSKEAQMKIKTERHVDVKIERDDDSNQLPSQPSHSDSANGISDVVHGYCSESIKQECVSTSDDVQSTATFPSDGEYSRHFIKTEFDISKPGSSLPNNPEVTYWKENTEFVSVKCEYDDASDSNDIEEEKFSVQSIPHYNVKVEKPDEDIDETEKSKSLTRDNLTEKDKHVANLKSLLECTNATLIRSQEDVGYTCYFCDKYYQDPSELKDHATNTHTVVGGKDFTKVYFAGYVAKMDITGLSCKLCLASIETLENALRHLHDGHKRNIFLDLKNQILPFKFNSNVHRCCICSKEFNKFRSLQSHVQTHYGNYICGECDLGFINRTKLVQHLQAHLVGEFKCNVCSKQFNTEFKKKKHEKNVHDHSLKVKCGICNERFKYPRQKELHLTKVHSIEPCNKCNLCDKVFVAQDSLSVHVKRDHLKARNNRCPNCEMCFFSPSQLRIHMVKHTGIPQFECDICHKSYRRKNYYYEHMRIHTNDRRHKCKLCDMAFVHKSSLRHHLWAKHGEIYVPGSR